MSLTYEGRLFCARKSMKGTFAGCVARALTQQERIDYQIPDGQSAAIAEVTQIIAGRPFVVATGIGRAGKGKDDGQGGSPIAKANPQEMADTRAKRRALTEAAPLGVDISVMSPEGGVIDVDWVDESEASPTDHSQVVVKQLTERPDDDYNDDDLSESNPALSAEEAVEVLTALKGVGITKIDLEALPADPLVLRKQGFSPEQVAARIYVAHIARLAAEEPLPEQITETQELPW